MFVYGAQLGGIRKEFVPRTGENPYVLLLRHSCPLRQVLGPSTLQWGVTKWNLMLAAASPAKAPRVRIVAFIAKI